MSNNVFEVHCVSPLDDRWEERDEEIEVAAGKKSDAGSCSWDQESGQREHIWMVPLFHQAQVMKARLDELPMVNVTIREEMHQVRGRKFKK